MPVYVFVRAAVYLVGKPAGNLKCTFWTIIGGGRSVPYQRRRPLSLGYMRGNPLVLAIAMAISSLSSSIASPYISPFFLMLGGTEVLLGIFWGVYQILNLLVVLPGGYAADVFGRKRILVSMTLLASSSFLLFSGSPFWAFLFLPQALAAVATLSKPALDATLADSMPERRRSTGFAVVLALSSVGWTVGPLVGGYLYDNAGALGVRVAFLLSAVGIAAAGLLYHAYLRETLPSLTDHGNHATKLQRSTFSAAVRLFIVDVHSAVRQMNAPMKRFFVANMFYEASNAVVGAYWPLLVLYSMGFSGVQFGFIELAAGISLIAFSIPMGRFSDRIGRPKAALVITMCSTVTLAYLVNLRLFVEVLLVGSVLDIFDPRPPVQGLRADVIPQEIRGRIISLLSVFGYAAAAASVWVGGSLYSVDPKLPFYVGAVLLAMSGLIFSLAKRQ